VVLGLGREGPGWVGGGGGAGSGIVGGKAEVVGTRRLFGGRQGREGGMLMCNECVNNILGLTGGVFTLVQALRFGAFSPGGLRT
jgi:hypothetical protein